METWKIIPETNENYQVSNTGKIKRVESFVTNNTNGGKRKLAEKELSQKTKKNGYKEVQLYISPQVPKMVYVHRAVASAFIGEIKTGYVINHKDGDKSNNNLSNLEIVTYSQNSKHAFDNKLSTNPVYHGSKHGMAKLDEDTVLEIRSVYDKCKSIKNVSEKYTIPLGTIAKICYRQTWKHI